MNFESFQALIIVACGLALFCLFRWMSNKFKESEDEKYLRMRRTTKNDDHCNIEKNKSDLIKDRLL